MATILSMAVAACGASAPESDMTVVPGTQLSPERVATLNAVNQVGWTDVPSGIWLDMAGDACERGAWDSQVARDLTAEYVDRYEWQGRPNVEYLPAVIWLNLFVACPDSVPDGARPPPELTSRP